MRDMGRCIDIRRRYSIQNHVSKNYSQYTRRIGLKAALPYVCMPTRTEATYQLHLDVGIESRDVEGGWS
jgi:hypothetical protein